MLDTTNLSEKPKIKKDSSTLLDEHYNNPSTSLLIFRFESHPFISSDSRLRGCSIKHASIEGKSLYIIDDFFLETEGAEMRNFSKAASFSRNSYGSPEAIEKGEKPSHSMNGKERWQFFSKPPLAINELYKLLGMLAHRLNADITTLPWELCDQFAHGSPAFNGNKLEESSEESMDLGKHQDCSPQMGISFGIPILYSPEKEFYPTKFVNGEPGKPWLITAMVYTTAEEYLPEYCMGTVFYQNDSKIALRTNCSNMRIVLFEGDILHSIEDSKIPSDIKTWRISYVFKLIVNPKEKDQNVKSEFFELISTFSDKIENLSLGPDSRA